MSAHLSWTVLGRVLPERANVHAGPLDLKIITGGLEVLAHLQLQMGHANVRLTCLEDLGLYRAIDLFRHSLSPIANYISIQHRGAYVVLADVALGPDGTQFTCPIYEPIFEPLREDYQFKPAEGWSETQIPLDALSKESVKNALHCLAQASRFSDYTMMYCRMALEAVRAHYDPPPKRGRSWPETAAAGEIAMCKALSVDRRALKRFIGPAAGSRHGRHSEDLTWELRKAAMEMGWELVHRHLSTLSGAKGSLTLLVE